MAAQLLRIPVYREHSFRFNVNTRSAFELRLTVVTELPQSEVCRTQEDLVAVQERWRAGLEVKGWAR
jgi:hypothetical protein